MSVDNRTITKASFNDHPLSSQACQTLQSDTGTVELIKAFATNHFGIKADERVKISVDGTNQTIQVQVLNTETGRPQGPPKTLEKQNNLWVSTDLSSLANPNSNAQNNISMIATLILTKVENAWLRSQEGVSKSSASSNTAYASDHASVELGQSTSYRPAAHYHSLERPNVELQREHEQLRRQLEEQQRELRHLREANQRYEAERAALSAYAEQLSSS